MSARPPPRLSQPQSVPAISDTIKEAVREILREPATLKRWARVAYWLVRRPRDAGMWFSQVRRPLTPLVEGTPFLSFGAIRWLEANLRPGMKIFEYGSGGSTVFFALRGCLLTSVEGRLGWAEQVSNRIQEMEPEIRSRVEVRHVDTEGNRFDDLVRYAVEVRNGGPWDLVLVDSHERHMCIWAAWEHVKPGRWLLLDNSDEPYYADVPSILASCGFKRLKHPGPGLGFGRRWATQTTVWQRV